MRAIDTGSKSARMTPLLGLAFFTSAMSLISRPAASGAKKSRTGGASANLPRSVASGKAALARSISWCLVATISSRMVIQLPANAIQKLPPADKNLAVADRGRGERGVVELVLDEPIE